LSFDDKYDYVNEHGHWVSGESEISDEQETWLDNNSDQHGLQSETVIAITETYAIKEAF
jgi:hypothetical protein